VGTVYHGLPTALFTPAYETGEYLAFVGRISPEKRVDRAVEVARRTGLRLRVAAKIDDADAVYYREKIAPLFELPFVEFIGEVAESVKETLLRGARALLFPIDWREPFGLVMIEAMACGTPVVAWRAGSVPEVLADGTSGFIVEDVDDAVEAVAKTADMDRRRVRCEFERRFTADRMAREYVNLYEVVCGR
jgi:glycosyltransferase involved in cell wall biosynthesis